MINQALLIPYFNVSSNNLDPDTENLIGAMDVTPDDERINLINTLIIELKDILQISNLYDAYDLFYMMAAHDNQAARLNWANPSQFTLQVEGSPTFEVDRGYAGSGTTNYLNTGWTEDDAVNFLSGDANFGIYSRTDISGTYIDMGNSAGVTQVNIIRAKNGASASLRLKTTSNTNTNTANSLGLICADNFSSTLRHYKNGAVIATHLFTPASALSTNNMFILAGNLNGAPNAVSVRQLSFAFVSKHFEEFEHTNTFLAIESFLDAIGAGVVS